MLSPKVQKAGLPSKSETGYSRSMAPWGPAVQSTTDQVPSLRTKRPRWVLLETTLQLLHIVISMFSQSVVNLITTSSEVQSDSTSLTISGKLCPTWERVVWALLLAFMTVACTFSEVWHTHSPWSPWKSYPMPICPLVRSVSGNASTLSTLLSSRNGSAPWPLWTLLRLLSWEASVRLTVRRASSATSAYSTSMTSLLRKQSRTTQASWPSKRRPTRRRRPARTASSLSLLTTTTIATPAAWWSATLREPRWSRKSSLSEQVSSSDERCRSHKCA